MYFLETALGTYFCHFETENGVWAVSAQYWNDSCTKCPNLPLGENILKQRVRTENFERGDEGVVFWIEAPVGIVEEDVAFVLC